jgi:hypothetical protein
VVETLVVPYDGLVPGYECGRCGALGLAADCCPDWGTAALPVPDLIEEMVSRTLEDGGRVLVVHDPPGGFASRMPRSPSVSERPTAQVPALRLLTSPSSPARELRGSRAAHEIAPPRQYAPRITLT